MDLHDAPAAGPGRPLDDDQRLTALSRSGLLDSPPEEAFDRATRLASRLLGTPVALVSIVDVDRQFFKSQVGLPEPWASRRQTPLTHSFCQHVVRSGSTLEVSDARTHPLLRDNLAIGDLSVIAYLGVPLKDAAGEVLGSFCVISDEPRDWTVEEERILGEIAEQVRTELRLRAALEKLSDDVRLRRDLMAMVAHDVRSPAAAIASTVATLHKLAQDDPRRAKLRDVIERLAVRIIQLSDQLLDLEREQSAGCAELASLLETAVEAAGTAFAQGRVTVEAPKVRIEIDELAVAQIVTNLVNNALKHTEGQVEVSARVEADHLRLVVRDHGQGLPESLVDELFERFRQGEGAAEGHGLGLYIVRSLVDRLSGTIKVSADTGGTEFTVELPVVSRSDGDGDCDKS